MKRHRPTTPSQAHRKPRTLESRRLAEAHGGTDLGIAVSHRPLAEDIMQQQHNEALLRLQ